MFQDKVQDKDKKDFILGELDARAEEEIDKLYYSPAERCTRVYKEVEHVFKDDKYNAWDLVCFAVGIMQHLIQVYPFVEKEVKYLSALVYHGHYMHVKDIIGSPDKTGSPDKVEINGIHKDSESIQSS